MIIVDPIALADTSFSGGGGSYYDSQGVLRTAPANTLRLTYDPADLTRGPAALIEPEATNHSPNSTVQGGAAGTPGILPIGWFASTNVPGLTRQILGRNFDSGIEFVDIRIFGTVGAIALPEYTFQFTNVIPAAADQVWCSSVFARVNGGPTRISQLQAFEHYIIAFRADGTIAEATAKATAPTHTTLRDNRLTYTRQIKAEDAVSVVHRLDLNLRNGGNYEVDVTVRIGLPQLERDLVTSPIRTSSGAVTRAADVVGSAAGLLYSNVPITEPDYNAASTYAKDALVHDPVTHNVFKSLIDANKGKALTDPAAWNPRGATNRWAMFDQYNNTQTAHPEEILIVLTPQAISEGLYIGNCEADEIELSVVDQSEGLVASEVMSLVTASGTSSYFDWCFRPADRSDYFVTTSLPPYANALVLVAIRKPSGVPKCGMLAIGGVDDFGPSLYGLSAEGKDYSSTTFNFDGTTNTELRPYAKRMSVDVQVDNGEIDYIQRKLFQIRQRPIVWIGGPYGATAVFGRYGSFKIVIPGLKKSDMALQIEGSV